jgi:hypothetical protein
VTTSPPDSRVDELRQQLKTLGYLDAGVDRFVLGPARESRRPLTIALLASARIGLLGALLLGPAAAIGLSGRLPGLVTGPRDAAVVALYLAVLFGAAVALIAFVASMLVAAVPPASDGEAGGRVRKLAVGAGTLVSIACLIYLTLWWQTANAGLGWASPVWTAFALLVAASISLLLGHAVTITALALTMAGSGGGVPSRVPGSSWRVQLTGGAAAFAGAAALLVLTAPAVGRGGEPPPLTVVSGGTRVRLFAIDGFDPQLFAEVSRQGRVPALSAFGIGGGARETRTALAELQGESTADPARAWTTLATGQPPRVHGVERLETRRVAGLQGSLGGAAESPMVRTLRGATDLVRLTRPAVASGAERRTKTLWEVASDAGLRTAVVNWWATWPAPADKGVILSDRATLRLETGGALDAEIAPGEVYERLQGRWAAIKAAAAGEAKKLSDSVEEDARGLLQRSAELDAVQILMADEIATEGVDLVCVYLPGLDLVQHGLLTSADGSAIPASVLARRIESLRAYYSYLDALLGRRVTPGGQDLVAILTGPGRVERTAAAVLALRGPIVSPQVAAAVAGHAVDVTPTLLYALGVPVARDLPGRVLSEMFDDEFLRRYPVREVATYGVPFSPSAPREGRPLDQEMIDRLRSLGYVR